MLSKCYYDVNNFSRPKVFILNKDIPRVYDKFIVGQGYTICSFNQQIKINRKQTGVEISAIPSFCHSIFDMHMIS